MENNRTQVEQTPGAFARLYRWLESVKIEFLKMSWTSSEELKTYTKLVVGATFICGMLIYFADVLIQGALGALGYLTRLIAG